MGEVPLYMVTSVSKCLLENDLCHCPAQPRRGTSLLRNRTPLGP